MQFSNKLKSVLFKGYKFTLFNQFGCPLTFKRRKNLVACVSLSRTFPVKDLSQKPCITVASTRGVLGSGKLVPYARNITRIHAE